MAELKTKPIEKSVESYIYQLEEFKQKEALILIDLFESLTKTKAVMWGESIIGFGSKLYHYKSGRQINYFLIGFSMRKKAITIYLMNETNAKNLDILGKHKKGVGCLYINTLTDINLDVLSDIANKSIQEACNRP